MYRCYLKLTAQDSYQADYLVYKTWIDKPLLEKYERELILPLSAAPSPIEKKRVEEINTKQFYRLTSGEQAAWEYRADAYNEVPEIEDVLQGFVRGKQVHSYARNHQEFYIWMITLDTLSQYQGRLAWKT